MENGTKEAIDNLKEDLKEIKEDIRELNRKLDEHIRDSGPLIGRISALEEWRSTQKWMLGGAFLLGVAVVTLAVRVMIVAGL